MLRAIFSSFCTTEMTAQSSTKSKGLCRFRFFGATFILVFLSNHVPSSHRQQDIGIFHIRDLEMTRTRSPEVKGFGRFWPEYNFGLLPNCIRACTGRRAAGLKVMCGKRAGPGRPRAGQSSVGLNSQEMYGAWK
jgi:hypothetical protein